MEPWQWILSLVAVVVAAALVPVLLQARRTLRAVEELAVGTRPKLERTLDEVASATARMNHALTTLEQKAEAVGPMLEGIADIGSSLKRARYLFGTVSAIGAALGPSLAAAMGSFFGRGEPRESKEPDEPAAAAEPTPLRRPVRTGGEA